MILAEKSRPASSKPGLLDFIIGLLSHRHAKGFRASREKRVPKANWWPTSPGYL
jgi:hypothetical protein